MRSSRLAAVLLGTVVLAAGCTSTVTGAATHSGPAVAAPSTDAPADTSTDAPAPVALELPADGERFVSDVAATPDGGFVALLVGDSGSEAGSTFVRLAPDGDVLTVGAVAGTLHFDHPSELLVTPDGSVVAVATVPPEAGDPSGDLSDGPDAVLAVLAPGSTQPELRAVGADPELGTPESASGVLSADGATLYAALRWTVDGGTVTRLATVDVATGAVTATAPLGVQTPGVAHAYDLALLRDGGVAVLVTADRDAERTADHTLLVQVDAALQPVGAPVELVWDEPSAGYSLAVLGDGTVVASVTAQAAEGDATRLVSVRDGEVQGSVTVPGIAVDVAEAEEEGRVLVSVFGVTPHRDGVVSLATVDLASGDVVDDVLLCASGFATPFAVAANGESVTATASCREDGVSHARAYLLR